MAKAEWGVKRLCPKCITRFFDLNQDPATCPACDNVFEISTLYQSDMRAAAIKEANKVKAKAADILDDEVDLIDDDADIDDELLEEDDTETVSLEEIADVPTSDDE